MENGNQPATKHDLETLRSELKQDMAQMREELRSGTKKDLHDMETKLLELTEVTPDDFKKLMDERAAAVQGYLLQSGKVEAGRITIAPSKAVDASFQGSNRVNLTLQ